MGPHAGNLQEAREHATAVDASSAFDSFVERVREVSPWRFRGHTGVDRFLHGVDDHLLHFVPKLLRSVHCDLHAVFDFGCGSGSSSIALALLYPEARFQGVDISAADVSLARERARLYGVAGRCRFDAIDEGQVLPVRDGSFDLCVCCSVLEYVTEPAARRQCVHEMARLVRPGGLLFMTVPNRLYPVEIHSRKLGWNYFPKQMDAYSVGSTAWEIKAMASPITMKLYRTPVLQLFSPWTNFCLRRALDPAGP